MIPVTGSWQGRHFCRKWFNGKQSLWFHFESPLFSLIRSGYLASLDHNTCTMDYIIVQCSSSSYFIVTQSSCFNVTLSSPTVVSSNNHISTKLRLYTGVVIRDYSSGCAFTIRLFSSFTNIGCWNYVLWCLLRDLFHLWKPRKSREISWKEVRLKTLHVLLDWITDNDLHVKLN